MTETKQVQTEYGIAEIEVVDCDSCGNTVGKEQAKQFIIGDKEGWACEHCEQNGPISFPEKVQEWALPKSKEDRGEDMGLFFFLFFAVITLPLGTVAGFMEGEDQFLQGYATASATYIVYGAIALGLWWFL
jgi:hypothetical protein